MEGSVQLVDQVVCNVMEKHRVTLLRCIYSMYKSCHLECKMQDIKGILDALLLKHGHPIL